MTDGPRPIEDAITVIQGTAPDPYEPRVCEVYDTDAAALWQKAIGEDLWFQFGIWEESPGGVLEAAGRRYFERQLDLADIHHWSTPPIRRVLDVGCGWGPALQYLPQRLPECTWFDALNVSRPQLEYTARRLHRHGLLDRVRLYQCNAKDLHLLPHPDTPYDLVLIRGVANHFPTTVYEQCIAALAARMRPGASIVISDNLFNITLDSYRSAIEDTVDRLALRHRKTLGYFTKVLTDHGFTLTDLRRLPSQADAIRWFQTVNHNIEHRFPDPRTRPAAFTELYDAGRNWTYALCQGTVSVYSIIATRDGVEEPTDC